MITKKVSEVDYVMNIPVRHKAQRLCHINMLKEYFRHPGEVAANQVLTPLMMCADAACKDRKLLINHKMQVI